ncbi:hypothetical protein BKA69DRAFT_1092925 [Paraphysoderma sedebokerense]|nr:hypothetical protein BKA69DRAFT_1092925 [Paraphysoderma sedebokerense]
MQISKIRTQTTHFTDISEFSASINYKYFDRACFLLRLIGRAVSQLFNLAMGSKAVPSTKEARRTLNTREEQIWVNRIQNELKTQREYVDKWGFMLETYQSPNEKGNRDDLSFKLSGEGKKIPRFPVYQPKTQSTSSTTPARSQSHLHTTATSAGKTPHFAYNSTCKTPTSTYKTTYTGLKSLDDTSSLLDEPSESSITDNVKIAIPKLDKLKKQVPQQKYYYPVSSNTEYGWTWGQYLRCNNGISRDSSCANPDGEGDQAEKARTESVRKFSTLEVYGSTSTNYRMNYIREGWKSGAKK